MSQPQRLRREDSFFGVHFDFHCRTTDEQIGRRVTREMVGRICELIGPDYIQVDCKGHTGVASYPSRYGATAPSFVGDPLRVFREETARRGVALYMHYSGVLDDAAVEAHPEWACIDAEGKPVPRATSVFSSYVDDLMIPQLLELARDYEVDGVWVDGDCWALRRDYSPPALAAWREATGVEDAPRDEADPDWERFNDFHRERFRRYVRHYVDVLRREAPGFQIASNWAYSSHMPEPVDIPVDFLSGDFWPHDSINSARFEGRILASQGEPWDLMAWGFATRSGEGFRHRSPKTAIQLKHEAAQVLALGGGFQCYFKQNRDASVSNHDLQLMAAVAPFCRERQAWCHRTQPVPQVGLLYSTSGLYRGDDGMFSPWFGAADGYRGVVQALVEGGHCVDALHDGHLNEAAHAYPVLVVPEWLRLDDDARQMLIAYARGGGNLLIIGVPTARRFADELGVKIGVDGEDETRYWAFDQADAAVNGPPPLAGLWGAFAPVEAADGDVELLQTLRTEHDALPEDLPAASIRPCGKGRIAALYAPVGRRYLVARDAAVRAGLTALVRRLFPEPIVELLTPADVDIILRRHDGALAINLINTSGIDAHAYTYDRLPPTPELKLRVRQPATITAARLQPADIDLPVAPAPDDDGMVVTVPALDIHGVVVMA